MQEFLVAIGALLFWRLVLSIAASIGLAAILAALFDGFTGSYVVVTVLLGAAFGIFWQGRKLSGLGLTEGVVEQPVNAPVAFVGLAFVGLLTGGFAGEALHSMALGAVALLIGSAVVVFWRDVRSGRKFSLRSWAFASVAVLTGYALLMCASYLSGQ